MTGWLLIVLGCGPGDAPTTGPTSAPTGLAPATGDTATSVGGCGPVALADPRTLGQEGQTDPLGDAAPGDIVRGIQGGWHVDVVVDVTTEVPLVDASGTLEVRGIVFGGDPAPHPLGLIEHDGCTGRLVHRLFVDPNALAPDGVCDVIGEEVTVRLHVEAREGTVDLVETLTATIRGQGVQYCTYSRP